MYDFRVLGLHLGVKENGQKILTWTLDHGQICNLVLWSNGQNFDHDCGQNPKLSFPWLVQ